MPRYLKQNGNKVRNVRNESAWIVIPVKSNKNTAPINEETYLVPPRVADYIVLLEKKLKGDIPKLPIKNGQRKHDSVTED